MTSGRSLRLLPADRTKLTYASPANTPPTVRSIFVITRHCTQALRDEMSSRVGRCLVRLRFSGRLPQRQVTFSVVRFPRWSARRAAGPPDGEVRLDDRAGPGWAGADVRAAFLESLQCLAVAEREHHLQVCAFLHFGQVQHGIDQARAATRGDVPGLGAQRRPGGSARSFGGDLGCGDCALIVADLDGHGAQPRVTAVVRTRREDGSRTGSRSGTGHGARAVRASH